MEYNEQNQFTSEQHGFDYNENHQAQQQPKNDRGMKLPAPNANMILTFGIISIVTCCCCSGILGIIFAIIAIILSVKSKKEFTQNSDLYDENTFGKVNAGKTCAIIGLVCGILMFIIAIVVVNVSLQDGSSIVAGSEIWDALGY